MRQIVYTMHFRGQSSPSDEDAAILRTTSSGTSCTMETVVGPTGVETVLHPAAGDLAFFESEVRLAGQDAFEGRGVLTFGDAGDHELRFTTVHAGHLGSTAVPGVMAGTAIAEIATTRAMPRRSSESDSNSSTMVLIFAKRRHRDTAQRKFRTSGEISSTLARRLITRSLASRETAGDSSACCRSRCCSQTKRASSPLTFVDVGASPTGVDDVEESLGIPACDCPSHTPTPATRRSDQLRSEGP